MVATDTFERFVDRLLEPLPETALADPALATLERRVRRTAWQHEMALWRFLEGQREFLDSFRWCGIRGRKMPPHAASASVLAHLPSRDETQAALNDLAAAMIRLPAPDKGAVAWKRSQLRRIRFLPIDEAEAGRCIAEDEAFIAANARRGAGAARPDLDDGWEG